MKKINLLILLGIAVVATGCGSTDEEQTVLENKDSKNDVINTDISEDNLIEGRINLQYAMSAQELVNILGEPDSVNDNRNEPYSSGNLEIIYIDGLVVYIDSESEQYEEGYVVGITIFNTDKYTVDDIVIQDNLDAMYDYLDTQYTYATSIHTGDEKLEAIYDILPSDEVTSVALTLNGIKDTEEKYSVTDKDLLESIKVYRVMD